MISPGRNFHAPARHSLRRSLLWLALVAAPLHAAPLRLLTEDRAPTNMIDHGQVVGTATDRLRAIMARTGTANSIEVLPWQRAYTLAQTQADTCVFSAARSATREADFQWVGPVTTAQVVLYGKPGREFKLRTLDDARPFRIGSYIGDSFGASLRLLGYKVDAAPNDALNATKLSLNRIDLWIGNPASMKRFGARAIAPVLVLKPVELYLACNLAVPKGLINRLNSAAHAMQRDGSAMAIEKQYANAPLAARAHKR
ncbi:MAG: ABC transporter substrate-binding protein [Pseudomonadota bacterium]